MKNSFGLFFILLFCACSEPMDPYEAYNHGSYKTAIKGFNVLAEQNDPVALTHLGVIYQIGLGAERDLNKSIKYYEEAASLGYAPAQYNLGLLYRSGLGVKQDYSAAYRWFSLAAEQGHSKAKAAEDLLVTELKVTFPQ
jgi:TPR repeat protein